MVDIVLNHVGPIGTDYSSMYPFNRPEHYHNYCVIQDQDFNGGNQYNVEHCRLAGLPDLNQENSYVREYLLKWVESIRDNYSIDGLRLDTACEVSKDFWDDLTRRSGLYIVGEVFSGNIGYVADYQNHLPALLNYPIYYTIRSVFKDSSSMYDIKNRLENDLSQFKDIDALGIFVDNHDNARFLFNDGRHNRFKSAICFASFFRGIAIMYYGSEQLYGGGNDPHNREQLWTNLDQGSEMYKFVQSTMEARKRNRVWAFEYMEKWVDNNFYAFARGNLLVLTVNHDNDETRQIPVTWHEGTRMCNIYNSGDCVNVQGGKVNVTVNGRFGPKVYEVSQNNLKFLE